MATVDDLVARVTDPTLRAQLAEQVATLVDRKQFGLVFQDHLPEAIEVPGLRPRLGDRVRLRGGTGQNYLVTRAVKGRADVVPTTPDGEPIPGDEPEQHDYAELTVVKDFGEPVYAGLKPLGSIERGGDKPSHVVIQGENYYALEALLYTHERKVDVIYIDPPYNTGGADWIYNDKFVGSGDDYRHSKWLAFMKRRLEHAKRMLKDTGVIIAAIGDDEHHRLRMLLDDVFGEQNFLTNVVWQGGASALAKHTGGGVDYMLFYAANRSAHIEAVGQWRVAKEGTEEVLAVVADQWSRSGGDSPKATVGLRAWWRENKERFDTSVSVYDRIDSTGRAYFAGDLANGMYRPNLQYDVLHPITRKPVKRPDNGWRHEESRMAANIEAGLVVFGPDETTIPTLKRYLDDYVTQVPAQSFYRDRRASSGHLSKILGGKLFPNPKDVDVVGVWLSTVAGPDAVVLDFFAGSGSTAEAVMRLNAQDDGRRQSIVVTNNELGAKTAKKLRKAGHLPGDPEWEAEGVFQKVTRPRIETVVTGTRRDGSTYSDGLAENVEFFELTYEDPNLIALGRRFRAIAPLLWMKAGATGPLIDDIAKQGWSLPAGGTYGVLFDVARAREFTAAVQEADGIRHAFIVTDSESSYQAVAASLPPESPQFSSTRLYSDFLHSFRVNGKD